LFTAGWLADKQTNLVERVRILEEVIEMYYSQT
jgi:hypothetical protein